MGIRIVRLGSAREEGEGLRIGTVRRPPRGVPKSEQASGNWYDLWLPELAPSAQLVKQALAAGPEHEWKKFEKKYRSEMKQAEPGRILALIAGLSHSAAFSVGCYCADEARCHRSILRELLVEHGALIEPAA